MAVRAPSDWKAGTPIRYRRRLEKSNKSVANCQWAPSVKKYEIWWVNATTTEMTVGDPIGTRLSGSAIRRIQPTGSKLDRSSHVRPRGRVSWRSPAPPSNKQKSGIDGSRHRAKGRHQYTRRAGLRRPYDSQSAFAITRSRPAYPPPRRRASAFAEATADKPARLRATRSRLS